MKREGEMENYLYNVLFFFYLFYIYFVKLRMDILLSICFVFLNSNFLLGYDQNKRGPVLEGLDLSGLPLRDTAHSQSYQLVCKRRTGRRKSEGE